MDEIPPQRGSDRRPVRRLTWLLLLLLAALGIFAGTTQPRLPLPGDESFGAIATMPQAPPVVAASGRLAEVYLEARPAVVRVESRCTLPFARSAIDVGSGFFISPQGDLLTAYHVIRRQSLGNRAYCPLGYIAVAQDGEEYALELVGFDAFQDVALLRAEVDDEVPHITLSRAPPPVGSEIVAIGNSRGEFLADRAGSVRRIGVDSGQAQFASGTIELTAAVAPGDSGGPVLAEDGSAFGVVSYISFQPSVLSAESDSFIRSLLRQDETPGFASYAVPVLEGSELLAELRSGTRRDVPVIGFELAYEYDPRDRGGPYLGPSPGVVVGRVEPGGPGDQAGLRSLREQVVRDGGGSSVVDVEADVIVAVDRRPVGTFDRLLELVRSHEVGDEVSLTVQRGNESFEVQLQLAAYRQVFQR